MLAALAVSLSLVTPTLPAPNAPQLLDAHLSAPTLFGPTGPWTVGGGAVGGILGLEGGIWTSWTLFRNAPKNSGTDVLGAVAMIALPILGGAAGYLVGQQADSGSVIAGTSILVGGVAIIALLGYGFVSLFSGFGSGTGGSGMWP